MRLVIVMIGMLAFVVPAASALAGNGAHEHHPAAAHGAPGDAHDPGEQRFATDQTLRSNMREIRSAVETLESLVRGADDPDQSARLAGGIDANVRDIIANCRLPADADAALHEIIHPLLTGAQALQASPADTAPVQRMREALDAYADRFDDPGTVEGAGTEPANDHPADAEPVGPTP